MAIEQNAQPTPIFVKAIYWLTFLKIGMILVLIVLFILATHTNVAEKTFMAGVKKIIVERYEQASTNPAFALGQFIGGQFFPVVLALVSLYFVKARNYWGTLIPIILDVFIGLNNGFPIFSFAIGVVIISNTNSEYFKKRIERESVDDDE